VPIAADGMATEGVVVAGIGRARMVDDPVELVVARGGRGGDPWRQVRRHVQVAQGKVHVGVQFPESLTRTESFQMEHEDLRELVDGKLLGAFAPSLTLGARGFFIAVEYFFLGEEIEAVVQFDGGVAVGRQRQ